MNGMVQPGGLVGDTAANATLTQLEHNLHNQIASIQQVRDPRDPKSTYQPRCFV